MNWKERIVCDPDILLGKPTIKGTRISVELILGCLEGGWTEAMIFESYSHITREDLRAIFGYVRELMETDQYFPFIQNSYDTARK